MDIRLLRAKSEHLWDTCDEDAPPLFIDAVASYAIAVLGHPRDSWWALTRNIKAHVEAGEDKNALQVIKLRHAVGVYYKEITDDE